MASEVSLRQFWSKQLGPGEIQAGIESVAFEGKVWGVDLPDQLSSPGSFQREAFP